MNFKTEGECKKHITDDHNSQNECEMCAEKFNSSLDLEWHFETQHEDVVSHKCI